MEEILHQLIWYMSYNLQGFIHVRWFSRRISEPSNSIFPVSGRKKPARKTPESSSQNPLPIFTIEVKQAVPMGFPHTKKNESGGNLNFNDLCGLLNIPFLRVMDFSPTAECYGVFAQYRFRCVLDELGRFREGTWFREPVPGSVSGTGSRKLGSGPEAFFRSEGCEPEVSKVSVFDGFRGLGSVPEVWTEPVLRTGFREPEFRAKVPKVTLYFESILLYIASVLLYFESILVYLESICLYFESILLYIESVLLYFESILVYLESICLYFENILMYFESIPLYFESIILYFESILL